MAIPFLQFHCLSTSLYNKYTERWGVYVPLIALQYHEIKLNLQFNPLSELLVKVAGSGGGTVTVSGGSLGYASFWVDYVYLDTDERRRFAQVSHEYLIEQIQFTGSESVNPGANKLRLNFNHPVKELVWVVIPDVNAAANDSTNYSTVVNGVQVNPLVEAKLQLNGHDRFDTQDGRYFNLVQPYQHHTNIPRSPGINVYSFALKPEEHQPSGSCNFSRIDNATLNLQLQQGMGTGTANVYAVNYNVLRIMSGMGGLLQHCRAIKLIAGFAIWVNRSASESKEFARQPRSWKTLRASMYQATDRKVLVARSNDLGMVKIMRDWAISLPVPNSATIAHGTASQTERVSPGYDGLISQNPVKVQSGPCGNTWVTSCVFELGLNSMDLDLQHKHKTDIIFELHPARSMEHAGDEEWIRPN
jgi:hypothetical protein